MGGLVQLGQSEKSTLQWTSVSLIDNRRRDACRVWTRPELIRSRHIGQQLDLDVRSDNSQMDCLSIRISSPRMGARVHFAQMTRFDARINLRCRQAGMTEQGLDRPQIGAMCEQMGCETVAQRMWGRGISKA